MSGDGGRVESPSERAERLRREWIAATRPGFFRQLADDIVWVWRYAYPGKRRV